MFVIQLIISVDEFIQIQPFKSLSIRVRKQVLADGFDRPLDWQQSGNEMTPQEWHQAIEDAPLNNTVVLDCRNNYESNVGIFEHACPLNTTYFRESWDALDQMLIGKPKDTQILTYCTGGIRCIKINSYLEQVKGFTNVNRLQGGIIAYTRALQNQSGF